jgi:hypothetical protein
VGKHQEQASDPSGSSRASRLAGLLPWLAVLAFTLSGLYVRLTFGRWPRVYRDSPDAPFTTVAAVVAAIVAASWPAMVLVALVLPVARWRLQARPVFDRWVYSAFAGAVTLYLLVRGDPYGFLEWALD